MSAAAPVGQPLSELPRPDRELIRGLIRGASPDELAWTSGGSPGEAVDRAHDVLRRLAPALADELDAGARRRVGDYLLGRQSPGVAAGTYAVMEASAPARRYALAVREALASAYAERERPAIPGVDDDDPVSRARRDSRPRAAEQRRREERSQTREQRKAEAAAAAAASPFREEAVEAHRAEEQQVRIPHYASRPTRIALRLLVAILVVGLLWCTGTRVPTFTAGRALVVDLKADAPGPVHGLGVLALFPPGTKHLRTGARITVTLPDTGRATTTQIRYLSGDVLSPAEIERQFGLEATQANRVRGPKRVAIAVLDVPSGTHADRNSFAGAVTDDVHVRAGSTTILGLL